MGSPFLVDHRVENTQRLITSTCEQGGLLIIVIDLEHIAISRTTWPINVANCVIFNVTRTIYIFY